jgi:hypothetical protein
MPLSAQQIADHEARLAKYAELRAAGLEPWAIAERMKISRKCAYKYASALKRQAVQA